MSVATVLYSLDDFLWAEEIVELSISRELSATSVPDLATVLSKLASDPERWNAYTLLSNLNDAVFDFFRSNEFSQSRLNVTRDVLVKLVRGGLVPILTTHVGRLMEYEYQNRLVRDISRASSDSSESGNHMLGLESSVVSGEYRICLNILFLSLIIEPRDWNDDLNQLLILLMSALRKPSHILPVRKTVLVVLELLRIGSNIPNSSLMPSPNNPSLLGSNDETPSPQILLLNTFPLSLPSLSDFRSLVALSLHQKSLIDSPIESVALDEGIALIDKYIAEFMSTYDFHNLEIDFMRNAPEMTRTFRAFIRAEKREKRTQLKRMNSADPNRISEFAKHLVGNYQVRNRFVEDSATSASETDEATSVLPLVNEIYASCKNWIGTEGNDDELIEAIANAAIPDNHHVECLDDENGSWSTPIQLPPRDHLREFIINLLKILLSSCRGSSQSSSPSNLVTFDIDRDHLLAVLERFEVSPDFSDWKRKNFEIISSSICGIFQILFSSTFSNQSFMESIFVANNGCLVLLKLITSAPEDGIDIVNPSSPTGKSSILGPAPKVPDSFTLGRSSTLSTSLFRAMQTLYLLTRHSPSRIKKFLVHYKLAVILKRFFRCPNISIQKIAYKLFKKQIRYLGKKWKVLHTRLISNCYAVTPTEVIDDWLINDPPEHGGSSPSEDVLNDSLMASPPSMNLENDYSEYIFALSNLNFENPREIEEFQQRFGGNDEFFFGYKNYRDYVSRALGGG